MNSYDIFSSSFEHVQITLFLEALGTIAFAISGIRLASAKRFDWFGAVVVGFVTAVGGGTIRDLLIGQTPFWMLSSAYIWCTLLAFFIVAFFRKFLVHLNNTIFWFDAVGLGLFTVVGYAKTMGMGYPIWVCIFMGTITGAAGGIIRDILINEIPIIFKQELYAMACIIGGLIFALCIWLGLGLIPTEVIVVIVVIAVRAIATRLHLKLPTLKDDDMMHN